MITLQEICRYLDELLVVGSFTDSCPNGLQVEGREAVRSIATAVTASLNTIEFCVAQGVDLLLVHHGIFWARDSQVIQGIKRKKLELLLGNQISLLAYHLPLDAHPQVGNNWRAAAEMGWKQLEPFCLSNGMSIGVRGSVDRLDRMELQKQLEIYYGHPAQVAFGGKEVVDSVALLSGGGYRFLSDAVAAGVDCFVTGNFDLPAWHQAREERMNFFALGHHATERIGPKAIGQQLSDCFGLSWQFIDEPNPF